MKMSVFRSRWNGFTLVELLVVIAIIGILIALLLPAIQSARESARKNSCQNNMRQIGIAAHNYADANKALPPGYTTSPASNFNAYILPFIEETTAAKSYDFKYNWDHANNKKATEININIYLCPSVPDSDRQWCGDYSVCTSLTTDAINELINQGQIKPYNPVKAIPGALRNKPTPFRLIRDGLSKTYMLFECAGRPYGYTASGPQNNNPTTNPISGWRWADHENYWVIHNVPMINNHNNNEIFGFHKGGCTVLRCDSSVHFLDETIDPQSFIAYFSANSGDFPKE